MTQELDALPLPKFTDDDADQMLRDMPWCKWSDARELVKACFWKGYELAKREAQEGREPIGWAVFAPDGGWTQYETAESAKLGAERMNSLYGNGYVAGPVYTSPPPKSDEARDAERYRWLRRKVCVIGKSTYCGEETGIPIFDFVNLPDVGEVVNRDSASTLDAAIDAALAAKKGGA